MNRRSFPVAALSLVVLFSLGSCTQEVVENRSRPLAPVGPHDPPFAVETCDPYQGDGFIASDVTIDQEHKRIEIDVLLDDPAGARTRTVTIEPHSFAAGWIGFESSITGGDSFFELGMDLSGFTRGEWRVVERTHTDSLSIHRYPRPSGSVEAYAFNGSTERFKIAGGLVERVDDHDNTLAPYGLGKPTRDENSALCGESYGGFRNFYPGQTTLEDNPDGEALLKILADEGMHAWLAAKTVPPSAAIARGTITLAPLTDIHTVGDLCYWANICVALKCMVASMACPVQALGNPLCHVCMGFSMMCNVAFLMEQVGWIDENWDQETF